MARSISRIVSTVTDRSHLAGVRREARGHAVCRWSSPDGSGSRPACWLRRLWIVRHNLMLLEGPGDDPAVRLIHS